MQTSGMAEDESLSVHKGSIFQRMKEPYIFKDVLCLACINREALEQLPDWKMRPDDVMVAAWPRSGTLLTKTLVWDVMNEGNIPEGADINVLAPFIEISVHVNHGDESGLSPTDQGPNPLTYIDNMDNSKPRLLSTHLFHHLMPLDVKQGKDKVILQLRNPKDATVSTHLVFKGSPLFHNTDYSFGEWLSDQLKGGVPMGDPIDHAAGWLKHKEELDILILHFEDTVADMAGAVQKIAQFVKTDLSPEVVKKIAEKYNFSNMKKQPDAFRKMNIVSVPHMRKGKVGDWKNHFTVAQSEEMDAAIDAKLKEYDIKFRYE